ncbi:hypothetical protein RQP46_000035 [Phenoliferia psychrophenolica]
MRSSGPAERCHCGGRSRDSTTKALFAPIPTDKWTQSYTSRSAPASPSALKASDDVPRYQLFDPPTHAPAHPQDESHELNSTFGSVLSPKDNWGCVVCEKKFGREEVIYPHPDAKKDPALAEVFFCRACFADRFSKGNCRKCKLAVLTDAPFVRHDQHLWHESCFSCTYCSVRPSLFTRPVSLQP